MQPHIPYLAFFSHLAPGPQSLWMLPLGVLAAAIVHALVTRRIGMVVGAAFVLAFYYTAPQFLATVQGTTPAQQAFLVSLQRAFGCVACHVLIACAAFGVLTHVVLWWRERHAEPLSMALPGRWNKTPTT